MAHLVTAPELANVTATYFSGREIKEYAALAHNQATLSELWQSSIALTGLQPNETMLPIGEGR